MEELEQSTDHIRKDIDDGDDKKPTASLIQLYEMPWREYLKQKNYDKDINNMCRNCQREQIRKYGEITIKCSGPKDISVLDQNIIANMNKEELEEIKQAMSPVYWAEKNIDVNQQDPTKRLYVNRWYQSMQLTCLHGDSEILMSDGSKKKIKDVNVGDMVVSYNEIRRSTPANRVLNKWNNGKKEVFRITLENGDYIDATADHKILGWIRTGRENQMLKCPSFRTDYGSIASGDIKVGTDIYVLNKYKKFGSVDDDNLAKILGYLCTDGYLRINNSYNRVEFRNIRKAYVDEIFNTIVDRFGDIPLYREFEERVDKSGSVHQKHYGIFLYKRGTNITSFLKAIGAVNKNTRELNILRWASKNLSEKSFGVFLNRVISGDGNVYPVPNTNTSRIAISGKYRSKFLYELKDILRSIGVYRAAIYHRVNEDGKGSVLHIANSHSLKALLSLTGKIFGKEENTRIVLNNISNISKGRRNGRLKRGAFNTSTRVKIVSIESIGVHDVYDIEVDKRHNFIANNIIVHNCSASKKAIRCGRRSGKSYGLGIDIANRLVQNSNYQILVVTPFLSQAKELTNVVKKILRSLGDTIGTWDDLVERSVTSPYQEIQMKNGSTFKAFTAGNDNANTVRGQGAHLIIIDEADFLTQEAFDSITAILMDKPNTEIICTSTPMGEGLLYKFSNSKDYKEFHFPSFVIPHYDDDMDKELRNSLSMMAYIQEICLRENEEVLTKHGKKYIQDIKSGDIVFDKNMNPVKVWQSARKTGHKEILKTTVNIPDVVLYTTPDHKFPNRNNNKACISELSELEVYRTPYKNNSKEEILARLIGYNLGDGTITSTRFDSYWYSSRKEDVLLVSEDIRKLWPNLKASVLEYLVRNGNKENALVKVDGMRYSVSASNKATRYLMDLGMVRGKKVEQEFNVPEFVLNGSESVKIEFIAALFGAEGSTPRVDRNGKTLSTVSLSMSKRIGVNGLPFFNDLKGILSDIGIQSSVTYRDVGMNTVYTLHVLSSPENLLRFHSKVGYRYCVRKELESLYMSAYISYKNKQSEDKTLFIEKCRNMKTSGMTINDIFDHFNKEYSKRYISKALYRDRSNPRAVDTMKYSSFKERNVTDRGSIFVEILSKELVGSANTYNIGVSSDDTSYILYNGVRTFNCAEFGLSDNSVFDTDLVNRSTTIGASASIHDVVLNRDRYIVSLGCDWNSDKVGTRICIIAYDKIDKKVIIANLSNVRREGWTQVAAIDKIVELNRLYVPDYIYVDEGFGEANVQQLKLIAVNLFGKVPADHPDLRLRNVTPVNFSSTLELRDVMTGEIRKKYFKNFIVETTKRALEAGLLAFKDPVASPIIEQMKNYVVKSRLTNGREVYEAKSSEIGDHDLDAFMIALAGLQLNEDSILDTRRYSNITVLPLEKRGTESYNTSNQIEKRSYTNEDKYHRTVRVAPGINRRSFMAGGPMGGRGSLSRETASTFMNRYKTTMRSKPR